MKRIYCRTVQTIQKVGNYFLRFRTPEYIEGAGCIRKLPELIRSKGFHHVMLVADKAIMDLGLSDDFIRAMHDAAMELTVFNDFSCNPTDENVETGFSLFRDRGCETIVAMGGGACIDCAKGIAAKNAHPAKTVKQLQGLFKVHKRILPIWAVPTTAGTGSETTVAALITIAKTHHKASICDPVIVPRYAVFDPELTVGLPPFITATTGIDALCHAVESYTNRTYCTRLERDLSKKAVRLIYDNLYKAYENGSDLEARQNMQLAAFYAGRSFTRGGVGYVHTIGHALGGLYGVAHGLAMAVILPYVLRDYGPAVYKGLGELAAECGFEGTDEQRARAFIEWIEDSNRKMGIPDGFDMIKDEDIPQMIKWAEKEANPLYPVPVIWGYKDFERLIDRIRR